MISENKQYRKLDVQKDDVRPGDILVLISPHRDQFRFVEVREGAFELRGNVSDLVLADEGEYVLREVK